MNRAFIAVDFVNDFVDGTLGSSNAREAAERALEFLSKIQQTEAIIFTLDTHPSGDKEFKLWGEHCLEGTSGSELWNGMNTIRGKRVRKGNYDAFFGTSLEQYLKEMQIQTLYIFGISTDICVSSTVSGAFYRNFEIIVLDDLCASLRKEDHYTALSSMRRLYGARIMNSKEVK